MMKANSESILEACKTIGEDHPSLHWDGVVEEILDDIRDEDDLQKLVRELIA